MKFVKLLQTTFVASCVMLGAVSMAQATDTDLRKGAQAFERDDYKTAFKYLNKAAKKGDAIAEDLLGYMYTFGKGVKPDYKKAFNLISSSCKKGNEHACEHKKERFTKLCSYGEKQACHFAKLANNEK